MKLTEDVKAKIFAEYAEFRARLYAGKTLEERKSLDQFFTPPSLTIAMIEKMDCESLADQKILDPTCGSGNLLVACLIAGADYHNIYGNEYDPHMVYVCQERLKAYCHRNGVASTSQKPYNVLNYHIHCGDAMQARCLTDFGKSYKFEINEQLSIDFTTGE